MLEARKIIGISVINSGNWAVEVGVNTPERSRANTLPSMSSPDTVVINAPPILSASGPAADFDALFATCPDLSLTFLAIMACRLCTLVNVVGDLSVRR